ncbi:AAA family ATPase [Enterovibrio norvegicus]|uniref:AAA family ATPase n=1 Tax=Enterovibrio norvegicus TaxID=188144 RepID=UPI003553DFD3
MIKLGRMRIENFKSFIEPIFFNFSSNDLILLDGPNGFGKTTIFDAIELCFTGKISRIKKTDEKTKSDHILKGDNSKKTSITLELVEDNETALVIEIIIPANISGENGKVAKYQNSIQRTQRSTWDNEIENNSKALDPEMLKLLLGNEKLDSTFNLFNYIQQEETCHFLKLRENERHQQVSHLFGTTIETDKANKLNALSAKLKDEIDSYTPLIAKEKHELSIISKPISEQVKNETSLGSQKIAILSNLDSNTLEQLESYIDNLEDLDWVIKNYQTFEELKFNYYIEVVTTQRLNEVSSFIKTGVTSNYDEIDKIRKQYFLWKKSCLKAKSYSSLIDDFNSKPNTLTTELLNKYSSIFKDESEKSSSDILRFNSLIRDSDSYISILARIDESRKNLILHYDSHMKDKEIDIESSILCPLCGDKKSSWRVLIEEYEQQDLFFKNQLSENGKLLADITKKIIKDFIIPLVDKMNKFLVKYDRYLNYDFDKLYKTKFIEKSEFDKMLLVKTWIVSNIEGYSSIQDVNLHHISENYLESEEKLVSLIKSQIKPLSSESHKTYLSYKKSLKSLGLSFENRESIFINSDDISNDIQFLNRLAAQKKSKSYRDKEKKLQNLINKNEKLSLKRNEIIEISKKYQSKIKSHQKNVAKNIAIPLFIYSSKILQSRPEGSGVFLITPNTENARGFMKFSATANDSHDAWNTMSSGQLSGVVISFMLAMNKVYPSKLATLMIDDPVQSMDEVNMASFVQMMKYEFPNLQVLLSTHESKVANYFNYKYNEAGLKTLPINMKKKRLEYFD